MPAKSKSQQRFFGVVKAMQKGDMSKKGEAGKVAKTMDKDDVDDFASTKHKGKPEKVKREQRVRELIKKMVREELAQMNEGLKRFSVYVSGQSKPLVLMGKDEKEVKQTAHMMLKNSSVKIRKVVKEGKLTEAIGKGMKWEDLKNGTSIEYTGGTTYVVTKIDKNKLQMSLKRRGKVAGNLFAPKATLYKGGFDSQIKTGFIKYLVNTNPRIKEGKLNEKMDKRKAAEILKMIGGNRFIAMTGAKDFAFSNKYMSFKIGRNSKGINFVRIAHNAKDLFDLEFGFVSVKGIKIKKKVKDVYNDMLGQIFTKYTGMHVRL